jgi:plasmid stabilization system protein ParE
MTSKLLQRASARRDILAIVDRIADDNPSAAAAVYEAYESSLERLKQTPDMGRLYGSPDPRLAHIRVWPIHRFHNYLIFYRHMKRLLRCCTSGTGHAISLLCSPTWTRDC